MHLTRILPSETSNSNYKKSIHLSYIGESNKNAYINAMGLLEWEHIPEHNDEENGFIDDWIY